MLRTLISTVQFLMIWCELPKPPRHPPPRATSMSTPPSNFYMMIRWHSCLLYTLYTHQHLISHFLGCSNFYVTPPPPPPKKKDDWKTNPQIAVVALWKMKSKGFHLLLPPLKNLSEGTKFCLLLWSRNPNPLFKNLPSLGDCKKKGDIPL